MPGFKTFASGVALPATDLNGYLMQQCVIACTSTTRPAAPNAGMTIYETDTGQHKYWDGASWDLVGSGYQYGEGSTTSAVTFPANGVQYSALTSPVVVVLPVQRRVRVHAEANLTQSTATAVLFQLFPSYNTGSTIGTPVNIGSGAQINGVGNGSQVYGVITRTALLAAGTYSFYPTVIRSGGGASTDSSTAAYLSVTDAGAV